MYIAGSSGCNLWTGTQWGLEGLDGRPPQASAPWVILDLAGSSSVGHFLRR